MNESGFDDFEFEPPHESFLELINVLQADGFTFSKVDFSATGTEWGRGEFTVHLVGTHAPSLGDPSFDNHDASEADVDRLFEVLKASGFEILGRMSMMKDAEWGKAFVVGTMVRWWPDGDPREE